MTDRLDDLLERVSDALHTLPGAVELYLFGSAADPDLKDAYSDLDVQVLSADYALSRAQWPWILEQAGEIALAYPILEKPRESVFSLVFAGESHYHKVDVGLSDQSQSHGFIHTVEHKFLLWQQDPPGPWAAPFDRAAWVPEIGTPAHFLLGELLGSVRYVKARKRGQHLTCWRFLSARVNALLRSCQWDGRSPEFPQPALITPYFTALDRRLPESDRLGWLAPVDCRTPQAMDHALIALTHQLIEQVYPGCAIEDTPAAHMVREILAFVEQELAGQEGTVENFEMEQE